MVQWSPCFLLPALALVAACAAPRPDFEGRLPTPTGAVFVRSKGRGPDVVLLHGLGDSSIGWGKLEPKLREAGFRVTVWDALGAGRSDKPVDGRYRLMDHVERLRVVLDALGIARPMIVANSLGGSIALLFALRYPGRVAKLALISPAAYAEGGWTGTLVWSFPNVAERVLASVPPSWIARLALSMNFGDPRRVTEEDVQAYVGEIEREGSLRGFVEQQRMVMPTPEEVACWTAAYPTIAVPVLVLWGTRDRILPRAEGRRLAAALPDARLVWLDGLGHTPQLEAPDVVLAHLLPFLNR